METWRPFTAFFRQAVLQKVLERWQEKKVAMTMNNTRHGRLLYLLFNAGKSW